MISLILTVDAPPRYQPFPQRLNVKSFETSAFAVQTVLQHALETLTKGLAPIAPFAAEDITEHLPVKLRTLSAAGPSSIFQSGWLSPSQEWRDDSLAHQWEVRMVS